MQAFNQMPALLVVAVLTTQWTVATVGANRPPEQPRTAESWRVTSRSGIGGVRRVQDLTVTVDPASETIVVEDGSALHVSIPAHAVDEISYDNRSFHARTGSGDARGLLFWDLWKRETDHFIHVTWRDRDTIQRLAVEARKGDYRNLLDALAEATGSPWRDIPSEREAHRDRLARATDAFEKALASGSGGWRDLGLDRDAWVGGTKLPSGRYQVVPVAREDGRYTLCFFAGGDVDLDELVAQVDAEVDLPAPRGLCARHGSSGRTTSNATACRRCRCFRSTGPIGWSQHRRRGEGKRPFATSSTVASGRGSHRPSTGIRVRRSST